MGAVSAAIAPVRPRVSVAEGEEPRLLEDVVGELAAERPAGVAWIVGKPKSGRTTAVQHLAAVYKDDERFVFADDASPRTLQPDPQSWTVATAGIDPRRPGVHLALADWGQDELIEYLLAAHHDACGSVIARLGAAKDRSWSPHLARIVLDRFAADESLTDSTRAIMEHVRQAFSDNAHYALARMHCLNALTVPIRSSKLLHKLNDLGCGRDELALLTHEIVQLALASEQVLRTIVDRKSWRALDDRMPLRLVEEVALRCRGDERAIEQLRTIVSTRRMAPAHPMAASILHSAAVGWLPGKKPRRANFRGGYFHRAEWPHVQLPGAALDGASFTAAALDAATLDEASISKCNFATASLRGASLRRVAANSANFVRADLRAARLPNASLENADFSQADLSQAALMKASLKSANLSRASLVRADLTMASLAGANLNEADFSYAELKQADLSHVDLRTAQLDGADLEQARMRQANLEEVDWPRARLREADLLGAHLTGSRLPAADLRGADLREAGLGEVDWERADLRGADLRGATFHMGSSRSGLVGSPIACEGSKTGFYTDDLEEMHFRPPEEIRKANLRGADLRGARIDNVDFYLVDLREARLDPNQLEHVRRCGAILEEMDREC
jgi:uncharacterized protein YjbI with pentapeptide repeats